MRVEFSYYSTADFCIISYYDESIVNLIITYVPVCCDNLQIVRKEGSKIKSIEILSLRSRRVDRWTD